jgi:hypothetical protein
LGCFGLACLLGEWSKVRLHASYGHVRNNDGVEMYATKIQAKSHMAVFFFFARPRQSKTTNGVENGRYGYLSEKPHGSAPARSCQDSSDGVEVNAI